MIIIGNRTKVPDRYRDLVNSMTIVPDEMKESFSRELIRRHLGGWRLPPSVYKRRKDILFYKESLERNSPYHVDLLKIENPAHLELVLIDLYNTIKIKKGF